MPRRVDVRGLREKHGLSQPELARRLGVSERSVRRWEVETVDPSNLAHRSLKALLQELDSKSQGDAPTRRPAKLPTDEMPAATSAGRPLGAVLPSMGRS